MLLGNGGSTAFWDAAAFGLIEQRSEHLVIGEFSSKFAAVTAGAPFLAKPLVVEGTLLIVLANFLADVVHAWLDPRVR